VNNKAVLATAAMMAVVAASVSLAAEPPRERYYTAAAPLSAYAWTGPYLGPNLGYQWGYLAHHATAPAGGSGGVQAGYNWQTGRLVFGGEGDLVVSTADHTFAAWKFANPWFGTLRARAGFAFNGVLVYGTLGIALGAVRAEGLGGAESRTHMGLAAGGGVEIGMGPSASAKIEYLYVSLADRTYALSAVGIGIGIGIESHVLRLGLNYRF